MGPSRGVVLRRSWVIAGAIFLIMAGAAVVWLSRRTSRIKDLGVQASPVTPSRPSGKTVADQSPAHAALREGRFDQVIEFFRRRTEGEWRAEDCFVLGSVLLERHRFGLGRAALEAARRIDAKHEATVLAIDAFRHKQDASTGRERAVLQESVGLVEPLQSIPGGASLGLFVLAVARYATNNGEEQEFFDRLRTRHLAALPRLRGERDAINLVARLLLETGRTHEARDLLEPLLTGNAAGTAAAPQTASERETAWLMSRAALQLGAHATADAMFTLSGEFGKSASGRLEPSGFVGSRSCGTCHRGIYRVQQHDSRHAQTLRMWMDFKDVPLPRGPVADPATPGLTYHFDRKNDHVIEVEARKDEKVFRAILDYAVGSGRHGITMLVRDEEGLERELRVSYVGRDGSWEHTKGIDFAPQTPGDHFGFPLPRRAVNGCLSCHATWPPSIKLDMNGTPVPVAEDRGIGCERCHGPGLNHVRAVESGFPDMAIALTSRAPSRARLESCAECHSEDGIIKPDDPEFTRFQGTTFRKSRCFVANKDVFSCTTCHSPHDALETNSTRYEAKCLQCHAGVPAGEVAVRANEKKVVGATAVTGKSCSVNPRSNCIACHMPKVDDPSRHTEFTDHYIRARRARRPADSRAGQ